MGKINRRIRRLRRFFDSDGIKNIKIGTFLVIAVIILIYVVIMKIN